jgi:zinc transport system substrate-binding protein
MRIFLSLFLLAGCGGGAEDLQASDGPLRVVTTFHPTEFLVTRIAGDLATVECAAPADADALFWAPDDGQLRDMASADLLVLHGAGMDTWRGKASLPLGRLVVACDGLTEHLLDFGDSLTHSHGGGEDHTHSGTDPHVWMDPVLLQAQARAVHGGLARVLPEEDRPALDAGLAGLLEDLRDLDSVWRAEVAVPEGEWLYASHPAYDYPAQRYGWPVVNLDLDPQVVPDAATLEAIRASLEERPGRVLMWEATPTDEVRAALEEATGLVGRVLEPCELLTAGEREAGKHLLAVQRANVAILVEALR